MVGEAGVFVRGRLFGNTLRGLECAPCDATLRGGREANLLMLI